MDYLEGALGLVEREAIDAHVAGCARCVAFIESYVHTPRILRAATMETLPAGAAASLRRFLAARR
ncbi:MAG TPA: zf-HC2 domain-containing protein [Solirubrobacterales bacterium]|nr:zf-HC2 domain-containing protein [Solirubrobacterales bacterium]